MKSCVTYPADFEKMLLPDFLKIAAQVNLLLITNYTKK
jgi:hypothetical protein